MNILAGMQTCFDGILRDIMFQPLELCFMPHEMIKRILLPKPAASTRQSIDLGRRELLP